MCFCLFLSNCNLSSNFDLFMNCLNMFFQHPPEAETLSANITFIRLDLRGFLCKETLFHKCRKHKCPLSLHEPYGCESIGSFFQYNFSHKHHIDVFCLMDYFEMSLKSGSSRITFFTRVTLVFLRFLMQFPNMT